MKTKKVDGETSSRPLLRVLILEDNMLDAELTAKGLERGGFRVQFEVTDSAEVFRKSLEKAEYDVILADFHLRDWTALDALDILKVSEKDIPLIVVTGSQGDESAVECIKRGAADYVVKDRPARLPSAIQRAVEENRLRSENQRAFKAISQLATIVESSDDAIIGTTLKGAITSWNKGAEKLYGYFAAEVLGQPISILIPPERSAEVTQLFAKHRRGAFIEPFETLQVRKDGSRIEVSCRIFHIRDASEQITGTASINREITERKELEQTLHESGQHFRSLFENMLNGYAYCKMHYEQGQAVDFTHLNVNRAFETLTGLKHVVDKRASEVIPGIREKDPDLIEIYGRVALTGTPERFEKFVNALGMWFAFSVYSPKKEYVVVVFDVISERKRAEAEHDRLVTAIEQSAEGVVITDTAGDIEYVNPAFTRITGYSREEVLGENPRFLKSDKHGPEFYQALWGAILKGEIWQGEIINRRKDGSLYPEEMSITPVRDPRGEITHFVGTKQDVTERKRLEQQLLQAQKMEAVGRLAGGVAHDFNNLLTIINGYAALLAEQTSVKDLRRDQLKEIQMAGERAASLTRQLLAFSRRQVLEPRVLNLNDVIADLERMLRRLIGEDVELVTKFKTDLGSVKADPGQVEQVIMNLAVNARDAMPEGGKLSIETSNVEADENYARGHRGFMPGKYVMVAVSDTGCGMDQETQAHIFEPFFTTKEKGEGTGLGLATVYGIVKQSGGFIWVYSEPGGGSTFKIYLPRVEEEASPAKSARVRTKPGKGRETILVVEDEEGVRSMVCQTLTSHGYNVLDAAGAEQALEVAEQHAQTIHLLLTDVVMPKASGKELATRLSTLHPETKVLYMSGYTDYAIVRHGILEGGTRFLQKPFAPNALLLKVREVLKVKPAERP